MHAKSVMAIFTIILAIIIGTMGADAAGKLGGTETPAANPAHNRPDQATQVGPLAPTGSGFTYQGRLSSGGNAANGQYDINFSLWDAASGGAQVGSTQTMANQAVSNGLF